MKGKNLIGGSLGGIVALSVASYFAAESFNNKNLRSAQNDNAERDRIVSETYSQLPAKFKYHTVLIGKTPAGPYGLEIADPEAFRAEQKCHDEATQCVSHIDGAVALFHNENINDFLNFRVASINSRLLECSRVHVQCIERKVMPLAEAK